MKLIVLINVAVWYDTQTTMNIIPRIIIIMGNDANTHRYVGSRDYVHCRAVERDIYCCDRTDIVTFRKMVNLDCIKENSRG